MRGSSIKKCIARSLVIHLGIGEYLNPLIRGRECRRTVSTSIASEVEFFKELPLSDNLKPDNGVKIQAFGREKINPSGY